MEITGRKRIARYFIGALLLAGALHVAEDFFHNVPSPDYSVVTMLFCLVFLIYSALLILWIQTVHARLLPSKARTRLIATAIFMLLYLVLRAFKYRIAADTALIRFTWYAFYLPLTFIPALFLMVCIRIGRGEEHGLWDERLTLIPAGLLSAIILTNDLHHLVFLPKPGIEDFLGRMGTYTYRLPFYLTYGWMVLAIAAGMTLLVRACGRGKNSRPLLKIAAVILLWFILNGLHRLKAIVEFIPPYESPEIHIFCLLAIFEICIRERLIPHNENYAGFFASLPMPVMITDRDFRPVYRSSSGIEVDRDRLSEALSAPVYPQSDQKLSGRQLRGGYAFWIEDESEVRKANEKLAEANELLESENTLIEYENRQKEQNAYLRSRHHIYHEIAAQMYPYQKRIEELLNEARPGEEGFRRQIAGVSVLNAYVKRKTNLLLMASEAENIRLQELLLAVSESARYLTYAGLRTSVDESGFCAAPAAKSEEDTLPAVALIALYDGFEALAEQLIGHASLLMVSFSGDRLTLAADADGPIEAPGTGVPVAEEERDGILYLTITAKKGGD